MKAIFFTVLVILFLSIVGFFIKDIVLRDRIEVRTILNEIENLTPDSCLVDSYGSDSIYHLYYSEHLVVINQEAQIPFENEGDLIFYVRDINGKLECCKWENHTIWESDIKRINALKKICIRRTK